MLLSCATISPVLLSSATISPVLLSSATISPVLLSNATISLVLLSNATISPVLLSNATISPVLLSKATISPVPPPGRPERSAGTVAAAVAGGAADGAAGKTAGAPVRLLQAAKRQDHLPVPLPRDSPPRAAGGPHDACREGGGLVGVGGIVYSCGVGTHFRIILDVMHVTSMGLFSWDI